MAMSWGSSSVWMGIAALAVFGCREEIPLSDGSGDINTQPPPVQFEQRIAFNVTGLPTTSRVYSKARASYSSATGVTTIETIGDSVQKGKLILQFLGGSTGQYRYSVRGASTDVQDMDMRFIPEYNGSSPLSIFELTENPFDSLEAQTTITKFGAVGDSIIGIFDARVKLVEPPMEFKIFLYVGEFKLQRVKLQRVN